MNLKIYSSLLVFSTCLFCSSGDKVKETKYHNHFALRDITLGKDNTIYLSARSAYISKDKTKDAFEEFQELHTENKMKRNYWKCNLKLNQILECTEELTIKDISNEAHPK